jgi:hypothetical protein
MAHTTHTLDARTHDTLHAHTQRTPLPRPACRTSGGASEGGGGPHRGGRADRVSGRGGVGGGARWQEAATRGRARRRPPGEDEGAGRWPG